MYKAIAFFKDLHDKSYKYRPGDEFPRPGLKVSPERIEELSTNKNRRGFPVIEEVKEPEAAEEKPEEVEEVKEAPKPKRGRKKKNAD